MGKRKTATETREETARWFWERVNKSADCWEWQGSRSFWGYGVARFEGRQIGAHRLSVILDGRSIPHGMFVCHHCDKPCCVRPDHLYVGSRADNGADVGRRRRQPHTILTEDAVRDIRAAYADGATMGQYARKYGVSTAAISMAARGLNWKHVQ